MKKFEVGKTYQTRSSCDYECIYTYDVISRTEKTITIDYRGKPKRIKIHIWDGIEYCYPEGRYSMCPIISADRGKIE